MSDLQNQIAKLQVQIESLEKLRPVFGDDVVDEKQFEIQTQLSPLLETGGGAVVTSDVRTQDFTGRDKTVEARERSVAIGGDAEKVIIVNAEKGAKVVSSGEHGISIGGDFKYDVRIGQAEILGHLPDQYRDGAIIIDSTLSVPEVRRKFRDWIGNNWQMDRKWARELRSSQSDISLKQWPIVYYRGICQVNYEIKRPKDPNKIPNMFDSDDWHIVQEQSTPLHIKLALPFYRTIVNKAEADLVSKVAAAINKLGPRYVWSGHKVWLYTSRWLNTIKTWVSIKLRRGFREIIFGSNSPKMVIWPDLAKAEKWFNRCRLTSLINQNKNQNSVFISIESDIVNGGRAIVNSELAEAIKRTPNSARMIGQPSYLKDYSISFLLPFWVVVAQ